MTRLNRRRVMGLLLAAAVLLAGLAALALRGAADRTPAPQGHWQPVSAEVQTLQLTSTGKVAPARLVDVISPAAGVMETLQVSIGDTVQQGQALGRIASPELLAQLRAAEAALLRSQLQDGADLSDGVPTEVLNAQRRLLTAQTALTTARAREAESAELYSKGIVSRNDDEAARNAVTEADMQVAQAREELKASQRKFAPDQLKAVALELDNKAAELALLRERQQRLALTAPLSGVVLYPQTTDPRSFEGPREPVVGARVTADQAIMAIGDTSSFLIHATCTEAEFAWLRVGAEVEVTLTALPQEVLKSTVVKVLGQSRSQRGGGFGDEAYEFVVALPAPGQSLPAALREGIRIGGTAQLKVTQKSAGAQTAVPMAALVWAPDGSAQVRWRASPENAPTLRAVRVARAGLDEVVLRDPLDGEVWVPATATTADTEEMPEAGGLSRLLGWE